MNHIRHWHLTMRILYRGDMYISIPTTIESRCTWYAHGPLFFPTWISVENVSFQLKIHVQTLRTLAVLPKNLFAVMFFLWFPPFLHVVLFLISKNVLFGIYYSANRIDGTINYQLNKCIIFIQTR